MDLNSLEEENYLCPSETAYVQPLRAVNVLGKWKIIVNRVKAHYDTLSQSTRIEICLKPGEQCDLTPHPYQTECVQKATYQRFLTYDPYDEYLPFSIDSFKLPSSCACYAPPFDLPEVTPRDNAQAFSLPQALAQAQAQNAPGVSSLLGQGQTPANAGPDQAGGQGAGLQPGVLTSLNTGRRGYRNYANYKNYRKKKK